MAAKYSYDPKKENTARVAGKSLSISTKQCIEICSHLKNRKVSKAKEILENSIKLKTAIPFTRFNKDVGHKTKIGPGRYPVKASAEILRLLRSAEANAQFKGLNTNNLVLKHICAQKASNTWKYGRIRGRKAKRTHIEIVVEETAGEKKKETPKPETKQPAKPVKETKPETKQPVKKEQQKQPETKPQQPKQPQPKPVQKDAKPQQTKPKTQPQPQPKPKTKEEKK